MNIFFRKIIPYLGFLGTAVGGVVSGQQINVSNFGFVLAFFVGLSTGGFLKFSTTPIGIGVWFFIATLPGTIFYLLHEGLISVPLKQYFGLLISWTAIWIFFKYNKFSPENLFKIYLQCAKISAIVGIFQQFGYLIGLNYLYDYSWLLIGAAELDTSGSFARVYSLFTEPGYFAAFLIPAVYFSLLRLLGKSNMLTMFESLVFMVSIVFTFSTIGYLGLLLCIVFTLAANFRNLCYGLFFISIVVLLGYSNESILSRISAIPNVISMNINGDENFSTLNNGINLFITKSMIVDHPLTAIGIGSYREYSELYLSDLFLQNPILMQSIGGSVDGLTLTDGGSMYLRLTAELGVFGIVIIILNLFCKRRMIVSQHRKHIAISSILFILIFSIRSGQLIRFDFMFFCALFSLIWFRGVISVENKVSFLKERS